MRQGSTTDSGAGRTEPGDWLSLDLPQQEAHGVGADLFDGEAGDAHPGGGQAEKRVFVHAGKPRRPSLMSMPRSWK